MQTLNASGLNVAKKIFYKRAEKNSANAKDRDQFAFDPGRRIYPELHFSKRSLAIAIMRRAWAARDSASTECKFAIGPM